MNRFFRIVTLSIFAASLIAGFATAASADPMSGRKVALGDADWPQAGLRPAPTTFYTRVEQASWQEDPALGQPVTFRVEFGNPIDPTSFTDADLVQNGSSVVGNWTIIPLPDNRRFNVRAGGLTAGTVILTIPAGVVEDAVGDTNINSASVDNSVTYAPVQVACDTLTYLYVAIWSPPKIRVYCVEVDGSLTFQGPEVAAPGDVRDMQISANGASLYYAHADLTRYYLSTDGSLALAGTREVGNGAFDDMVLDPDGEYLYATHSTDGGSVIVYNASTVATVPPEVQSVNGFYIPHGLAVHPTGQFIYIANYYDIWNPEKIVSFPLLGNGRLDLQNAYVTDFTARAMYFAIHPTLNRLYWTETAGGSVVTGSLSGAQVSEYDIDFSGFGARPIAIDENGDYVYAANNNNDDIGVFRVTGGGGLVGQNLRATARRPEHLLLHPNGGYLYVASAGDSGGPSVVSIYQVLGNGDLFELTPEVIPDQGAYRLAIVNLGSP